jgi:glycosyltransferase involved in cell wall biosynthesis
MDKCLGVVMLIPTPRLSAAGVQKQALALANQLQSQEVRVCFVTPTYASNNPTRRGSARERPHFGKLKVTYLFTLRLLPSWSFLGSFLLWACMHRRSFHVIHAHNPALGVIACLVGWLMRKKVIVKIPSERYVHYLSGATLWRRLRRWTLTRRAARLVAVSTAMAHSLQAIGIAREQITMIPNGVEIASPHDNQDRFSLKTELLGNAEVPVVLFVGRLVEEKGVDRLLQVWASMPCRENLRLLIVGDGPLREVLEAMALRLNLRSSVRFLGHQTDVARLYGMADVFVLPSRTEGLSNALLEALASGVPAIVSNVGGNRDVIADQESGFLVDWEDTLFCGKVLATLLADPDLRQRVGNAAKRRALAFDLGHVAHQYKQLYGAILQE